MQHLKLGWSHGIHTWTVHLCVPHISLTSHVPGVELGQKIGLGEFSRF